MAADIRRTAKRRQRRYVASQRHTIQVDFDTYLYDLRRERRRGAARAAAAGRTLPVPARAAAAGAAARPVGEGAPA